MSQDRWYRRLFSQPNTSRGQHKQRRWAGIVARPRVELLEDRPVLSDFSNMLGQLGGELGALTMQLNGILDQAAKVPFINHEQGLLNATKFLNDVNTQLQALSKVPDPTDASTDMPLESAI